jgi:hypothetical protein
LQDKKYQNDNTIPGYRITGKGDNVVTGQYVLLCPLASGIGGLHYKTAIGDAKAFFYNDKKSLEYLYPYVLSEKYNPN